MTMKGETGANQVPEAVSSSSIHSACPASSVVALEVFEDIL